MANKIRCPKCANKLTKILENKHSKYSYQPYKLVCRACERKNSYRGFRGYFNSDDECYGIECHHFIGNNKFYLEVKRQQETIYQPTYKKKTTYPVKLYLESGTIYNANFNKIKEWDGYDLIDQNVDVFDFDSLFLFFRKECIRWYKLRAFL